MGLFSKLFGRSNETDDQREIRLYNENKPEATGSPVQNMGKSVFVVNDVFSISGRGTVVVGTVTEGSFSVGDKVIIDSESNTEAVITGIEMFRKLLDTVHEGDNAGILLGNVPRNCISRGDLLIK